MGWGHFVLCFGRKNIIKKYLHSLKISPSILSFFSSFFLYISHKRGMVQTACVSWDVPSHIRYMCLQVCVLAVSESGGVRQGGELLMTHTDTRIEDSCTPDVLCSHVWIPFIVFMDGGHRDQSHPTPLTSGLADLSARLLINQSDDRSSLQTIKTHSNEVVEAQWGYHAFWKADLSKAVIFTLKQHDAFIFNYVNNFDSTLTCLKENGASLILTACSWTI